MLMRGQEGTFRGGGMNMVTKQQLQNMLDETIEELEKADAAMQGNRFLQLIHHRANLEMRLRDLEKPEPEPEPEKPNDPKARWDTGPYYGFFTARHPQPESFEDLEEELFS